MISTSNFICSVTLSHASPKISMSTGNASLTRRKIEELTLQHYQQLLFQKETEIPLQKDKQTNINSKRKGVKDRLDSHEIQFTSCVILNLKPTSVYPHLQPKVLCPTGSISPLKMETLNTRHCSTPHAQTGTAATADARRTISVLRAKSFEKSISSFIPLKTKLGMTFGN